MNFDWLEWTGWGGIGAIAAILALIAVGFAVLQFRLSRSGLPGHGLHFHVVRQAPDDNGTREILAEINVMGNKQLYEPQIRTYGLGVDVEGEGRRYADVHSPKFGVTFRTPDPVPPTVFVGLTWLEPKGRRVERHAERITVAKGVPKYEKWRAYRWVWFRRRRTGRWLLVRDHRISSSSPPPS